MSPVFSPTKVLDSLILMQLDIEGPLHGYALAFAFEEKFGWKPSQTAIYNSLKSIEQDDLVTVEEKIESGRVQKIYTITKSGRTSLEKIHEMMKQRMMRNFANTFSVMQMLMDSANSDEQGDHHKAIHSLFKNFKNISRLTLLLIKEEPERTQAIIETTLKSLKELAAELDVDFEDIEEEMFAHSKQ